MEHQQQSQSGEGHQQKVNNSECSDSVPGTIPSATVVEGSNASMLSATNTIRRIDANRGRWQPQHLNTYYQSRPQSHFGPRAFQSYKGDTSNFGSSRNHFNNRFNSFTNPAYPVTNTVTPDRNMMTASASYGDSYRSFRSNDGQYNVQTQKGPAFQQLSNGYQVLAWSISGIETNVLVRRGNRVYAFDMGYAHRNAVEAEYVFISHGHVDHIHGIVHHASKRNLYRKPPATYYVPAHLVENVREIARQFAQMQFKGDLRTLQDEAEQFHDNEDLATTDVSNDSRESTTTSEQQVLQNDSSAITESPQAAETKQDNNAMTEEMKSFSNLKIVGVENGKQFTLQNGAKVLPFATCHRVPSSGYLIYERVTDRYTRERSYIPSIAYTGDTTFDVFLNPPIEDLLRVRLLISECTYIGQSAKLQPKANEYKHVHFDSFIENAALFEQVQHIVLVHFSDRHHPSEIKRLVDELSPPSLRGKIFCATMAQDYGL